ncbi:MAG: OmpH family outer membrane protein [Gammaproteobacteria bacterium]|nr:OmpH family outer membrane protein [Pseudomonadales bacterium]MCP5346415.1 OmpH family outer membrane protein [Pseudomonadales bacterium]
MNRIKFLMLMVSVSLLPGLVAAQDTKIGIINLEQALFNSEAARVVQEDIRSEFSGDEQRAQTLQQELMALQQKFNQDEAIMSESEKRQLNADAQEKQLQLQLISERVQQALQQKNQQFVESMRQTLSDAITEVVADGGYDLILNASGVAYADPVLDITPKVTAKINELRD